MAEMKTERANDGKPNMEKSVDAELSYRIALRLANE
jgi:hypothetical protein